MCTHSEGEYLAALRAWTDLHYDKKGKVTASTFANPQDADADGYSLEEPHMDKSVAYSVVEPVKRHLVSIDDEKVSEFILTEIAVT